MKAMSKSSELYYSDQVDVKVEFAMTDNKETVELGMARVKQFHDDVKTQIDEWEKDGVVNIFSSFESPQYDEFVCLLSGTKPWSEEKIEAFKKEMHEDKAIKETEHYQEVETLKSLMAKHPDVVAKTLTEMLKAQ